MPGVVGNVCYDFKGSSVRQSQRITTTMARRKVYIARWCPYQQETNTVVILAYLAYTKSFSGWRQTGTQLLDPISRPMGELNTIHVAHRTFGAVRMAVVDRGYRQVSPPSPSSDLRERTSAYGDGLWLLFRPTNRPRNVGPRARVSITHGVLCRGAKETSTVLDL